MLMSFRVFTNGTMMTWKGIIIAARMMRNVALLPRKVRWLSAYPAMDARIRMTITDTTVTSAEFRK
jgi:hypothetical protein